MTTTLLFGILLIVAGVALAILAYALIMSRRGDGEAESLAAESQEPIPSPCGTTPAQVQSPGPPAPAPPAAEPAGPSVPPPAALPTATPPAAPPPLPRTVDVARLLRDDVTGALQIAVGSRVYRTLNELRDSPDLVRVEAAARDLQAWFAAPAKAKPPEDRRAEAPAQQSGNMLDQINKILERKLALVPDLPQGVRLAPSPDGGVRVLIGLQSYPLDQVPEARINQLIRDSVAEWENRT
jgi:hypothetical protein